jgi:hypothetical protein
MTSDRAIDMSLKSDKEKILAVIQLFFNVGAHRYDVPDLKEMWEEEMESLLPVLCLSSDWEGPISEWNTCYPKLVTVWNTVCEWPIVQEYIQLLRTIVKRIHARGIEKSARVQQEEPMDSSDSDGEYPEYSGLNTRSIHSDGYSSDGEMSEAGVGVREAHGMIIDAISMTTRAEQLLNKARETLEKDLRDVHIVPSYCGDEGVRTALLKLYKEFPILNKVKSTINNARSGIDGVNALITAVEREVDAHFFQKRYWYTDK